MSRVLARILLYLVSDHHLRLLVGTARSRNTSLSSARPASTPPPTKVTPSTSRSLPVQESTALAVTLKYSRSRSSAPPTAPSPQLLNSLPIEPRRILLLQSLASSLPNPPSSASPTLRLDDHLLPLPLPPSTHQLHRTFPSISRKRSRERSRPSSTTFSTRWTSRQRRLLFPSRRRL